MDDGLWHPEDYDDVPRSNGNFGLDPFQQACQDAEDVRLLALKHSNPRDKAVSPAAEKTDSPAASTRRSAELSRHP